MKKIVLFLVGLLISCLSFTQTTIWSSDFSNASDWTITNNSAAGSLNWSITNSLPTSVSNPDLYKYWFTPLTITSFNSTSKGNFALLDGSKAGSGTRGAIIKTANSINLSGKPNVIIKFQQLYRRYKDSAIVEVSTDNIKWTKHFFNGKYAQDSYSTNPENVSIDISKTAGDQPKVWIRFRFVGNTLANDFDYAWFIDDFSLQTIPDVDASNWFSKFKTQSSKCGLVGDSIGVYIINKGITALTNTTQIGYKINSDVSVVENAVFLDIRTLLPKSNVLKGDTAIHYFSKKIDFSSPNTLYNIKVFVNSTNDSDRSNDTSSLTIKNYIPFDLTNSTPYSENFEAQVEPLGGFTSEKINNTGALFRISTYGNTQVTANGKYSIVVSAPAKGVSEDWAYSRCLYLSPDYTYTLSYYSALYLKSSTGPYAGKIESKLGTSNSSSSMTQSIGTLKTLTPDGKFYQTTNTFNVTSANTYYLGFKATNTSKDSSIVLFIDDVSITAKGKNADILTFSLKNPAVNAVINGKAITLDVSSGTNVTALISTFTTSPGAVVKVLTNIQSSGTTANNFTNSITYVVTSEDGLTTNNYIVSVNVPQTSKSSAKDILTYSINGVNGIISGNNITVALPSGTSLSNLTAVYTTSPKSSVTTGANTTNYTNPATYVVTAEDLTTKTYTVTVSVSQAPKSTACDLISFGILLPLKLGIVNGTDVTVILPSGTALNSLIATFTVSPGATVKVGTNIQTSGVTTNDFTSYINYDVTAEDGVTKKTYKVKVNVLPTSNLNIWSSDFSNQSDWLITSNGSSGLNWIFTNTKPTTLNANNGWVKSFTAFNSATSTNNFIALDATNACSGSRKAIITSAKSFSTLNKSDLVMKFSQLYAKSPSDVATVEISTDNKATWKQYTYNNKYAANTGSTNPENVVIDISADAANKSSVWVRFVFTGTTGTTATDYGWFIDDFSVEEIPSVDALGWFGVFKTKTSSCGLVSDSIGVYVINKGITPLTGTTSLSYKINNNSSVTENSKFLDIRTLQPKTSLIKGDTAIHFFSSKIDISNPGTTYNILAFVNAPSDVVSSNDSVKFSIINYNSLAVTNLVPYNEDFENQSLNGFTVEDVDKKGLKFGLAATGNLDVTTSTPASNLACLRIFENNVKGTSDDWVFSRCLDLDPNFSYTLSYYSRSSSTSPQTYAGKLSVSIGNSASSTSMTKQIVASKILTPDAKYYKNTSTFKVDKTGTYYLGFRGYNTSADSTIAIRIDDISLTAKGSSADILTFSLKNPAVNAVINGKAITLDVSSGTNVTALISTFTTSPGAVVKVLTNIQSSGTTANNFTNSITYVVTSEDGLTTNNYIVTVNVPQTSKSSAKDILTYSINGVNGVISGNAITLTLPIGTSLTNLTAVYTTSPKSSVTTGANTTNFTNPATYVVTAEDLTTKTYTVTVLVSQTNKSSAKDILTYSINGVNGVISGNAITLTLPIGTSLTNLTAVYTTSPNSSVTTGANTTNFTNPVTYVVTAEDLTTKTYTVTVTVSTSNQNTAADILTFGFTNPNVIGVISGTTITVSVPYGTNIKSLVSTFTVSTGASVKVSNIVQNSGGSVIDYTSPVTFAVTSQDGKTVKTYIVTVTITPLLSSAKEMITFGFASPSAVGTISGNTIGLTVPFGTNVSALVANFTSSPNSIVRVGSTIQLSGTTPNSFNSTLMYTVIAQDGSAKDYLVEVIVSTKSGGNGSSDKDILSFGLLNPYISGAISGTNITITGQQGSDITKQQIYFSVSPGAILTLNGVVLTTNVSIVNFTNPVNITVTATDGSKKDYVVTVIIPKKSDKEFTFFRFIESPTAIGKINDSLKTITVHVPYSFTNNLNFTAVFGVSPGAIVKIGNIQQSSGASQLPYNSSVVFTVVAEDGTTVMYTVIIIVDPQVLGVEEEENSVVRIYPNPSIGVFTCESSIESYDLNITDILGHTVYTSRIESNGTDSYTFDLTSFGSGVYFATLHYGTSSKLIKLEVIK